MRIHSVSLCGERLNHQFLINVPPLPHHRIRVPVDNEFDIVFDILFLSTLLMNGDRMKCEGLKRGSDVNLRPTSDAKVKIRKLEAGKILYEIEHVLPR